MVSSHIGALSIVSSLLLAGVGGALAQDRLEVYRPYPPAIRRNFDYDVRVVQGETTKDLVIYNHCEGSLLRGRGFGGDNYRRFCEFAFSGQPVRVDIAVKEDVDNYTVMPSAKRFRSRMDGRVITVFLDGPAHFALKLHGDTDSILSVFADAPENPAEIPDRNDPSVLYVDSWLDASGPDGRLSTGKDIKRIYIAPGAVLNARLTVGGDNCVVSGRGAILDPFSNIFKADPIHSKQGLLVTKGAGVLVRDIKLLDAKCFNIILAGPNSRMENVKALSSMMTSDGISIWGAPNPVCERCYLYVGDNALVVGGSQPALLRDIIIGTTCAAIFPQSSFKVPAQLRDINVFRCDEGLINNYYNGSTPGKKEQTIALDIENLSAVDCDLFPWIFQGRNMGTLPKTVVMKNIAVPEPTGDANIRSIGKRGHAIKTYNRKDRLMHTTNYDLRFTNLFVGGQPISSAEQVSILDSCETKLSFVQEPTTTQFPLCEQRHAVAYRYPYKVYVGAARVKLPLAPVVVAGELYLPYRELCAALDQAAPAGAAVSVINGHDMITLAALQAAGLSGSASWDRERGRIDIAYKNQGRNILAESSEHFSRWAETPPWRIAIGTLRDDDGAVIYNWQKAEVRAGMQSLVTDEIKKHGPGRYTLCFSARTSGAVAARLRASLVTENTVPDMDQNVDVGAQWQDYSLNFDLQWDTAAMRVFAVTFRVEQGGPGLQLKNIALRKE